MTNAEQPPVPFLAQWLVGLVYIPLVCAVADGLALVGWYPVVVAVAALLGPIFLGLPALEVASLAAPSREAANRIGHGLPALLGGIAACVGAAMIKSASADLAGAHLEDVSVTEAREHPGATTFTFRDAYVLVDRVGSHRVTSRRQDRDGRWRDYSRDYQVAPLVHDGWQPGEPVSAWLTDGGSRDPVAEVWLEPRGGGRRAADRDGGYAGAIADVFVRHRLTAAEGAPLLHWEADPRGGVWSRLRLAVWIQWGVTLLWAVGYPIGRGVARRVASRPRSRPRARGPWPKRVDPDG